MDNVTAKVRAHTVEQPAKFSTLLTAAIVATINVVAILFNWPGDVTACINIAAAAWVAVLGYLLPHMTGNDE